MRRQHRARNPLALTQANMVSTDRFLTREMSSQRAHERAAKTQFPHWFKSPPVHRPFTPGFDQGPHGARAPTNCVVSPVQLVFSHARGYLHSCDKIVDTTLNHVWLNIEIVEGDWFVAATQFHILVAASKFQQHRFAHRDQRGKL